MLKTALQITKVQTLQDNSLKISAVTPELNHEAMSELFRLQGKECACILQASINDTKVVEALNTPKNDKSPSKRLRNALMVLWGQTRPDMSRDAFYELRMEEIISLIKEKLN